MKVERPENSENMNSEISLSGDFTMPPFLNSADRLSEVEEKAMVSEFEGIALEAKNKRKRFAVQFSDKPGYNKVFDQESSEFDPNNFYV